MSTSETVQNSTPAPVSRLGKPGVVRNVFSNWGSYVIAMAINFLLSPYVVHHLGNTAYGVWTVTLSLTGYLGLLDLGVRGAVTRYVARFHTQQDHEKSSNVASSAMVIFATAGLVAILTSMVLAAFVVGRMKIPAQYVGAARIVLLIIGFNIAVSLVNGVFGGILVGLQRFDLTNSIEVGISLLRAVAIVTALHLGYGIITLAILQLTFTMMRWGANIGLARHLYPELRIRLSQADRTGIKLIFSFSVFSFLLHVSDSLIYASDNVVIAAFLPVTAVTFYVIGGNLVEYSRTIAAGISQTMTPLASSVEATRDHRKLQEIVLFGARAGSMIMFPIAITFLLRGSTFIGLWMGSQYAYLSGKVLWILAITLLFWAGNSVTAGSLLGLSKHKPLVPAMLVEGLFNLVLSIILVRGRLGVLGVAWGTAIPSVAANMLFWPWYVHRALGIRPIEYAMSTWIRPTVAILPFALGTYAIERDWPVTHVMFFFVQVVLVLPLAVAGYWLLCLDRTQREVYSRKFSQSLVKVFARG
jgi:O-antigen/teichoic acid export membrane protein